MPAGHTPVEGYVKVPAACDREPDKPVRLHLNLSHYMSVEFKEHEEFLSSQNSETISLRAGTFRGGGGVAKTQVIDTYCANGETNG